MTEAQIKELCSLAIEARSGSYAPYSKFRVGAALLASDGTIYKGCNIENASYGATNCAERTAFFKAVSEGALKFTAIAIAGGPEEGELQYCAPCGICRQVMAEFCGPDFMVYMAKAAGDYKAMRFGELLPEAFGPGNLE